MKFANFGEQLAKPVKFIKERSAFLPKPIQRIVILLSIFVGLPVFLIGFLVLRIWEYKNVSLYSEYKSMSNTETPHKNNDLNSLYFEHLQEDQEDGYRDGYAGFGTYFVIGKLIPKINRVEISTLFI